MNLRLNRRGLLAALGVGGIAVGLGGCGLGGEQKPTTAASSVAPAELKGEITFQTWSLKNEKFSPYFEKLVKDFEAQHAGTKINWIDQPGDGYEEKVLQQANAGQLPDVINLPQGYSYQLAKANKMVDLKKADEKAIETYTDGGIEAYTFDGMDGVFGYPWYLGTDLNWWNTKAFTDNGLDPKKLPTTLDELFDAAEKMASASGGKMPLLSSPPALGDFTSAGIEVYKDGKFVFNDDKAVAILQRYVDLYKAKAMPPEVLSNDYLGNSALYIQGKVAWTTGSASFPVDLAKEAPAISQVTTNSKRIGVPPLFVQGISVSADSKNPALALAFAQFVTNNANQVEFVKLAQGFLPGTKEANANPESFTSAIKEPQKKAAAELLAEEMKEAKVGGPVQYSDAMSKYTGQQFTAAMRGDKSAKEALDAAVKYCNDNQI